MDPYISLAFLWSPLYAHTVFYCFKNVLKQVFNLIKGLKTLKYLQYGQCCILYVYASELIGKLLCLMENKAQYIVLIHNRHSLKIMADVSNIAHVSDKSLLRIWGKFNVVHFFLFMYTNIGECWQTYISVW
jgi:hypothetical protein